MRCLRWRCPVTRCGQHTGGACGLQAQPHRPGLLLLPLPPRSRNIPVSSSSGDPCTLCPPPPRPIGMTSRGHLYLERDPTLLHSFLLFLASLQRSWLLLAEAVGQTGIIPLLKGQKSVSDLSSRWLHTTNSQALPNSKGLWVGGAVGG